MLLVPLNDYVLSWLLFSVECIELKVNSKNCCPRSRHGKSNMVIQVCNSVWRVWSDALSWITFPLHNTAIVLETLDCSCVIEVSNFFFHLISAPSLWTLCCKVLMQLFLFCLELMIIYFNQNMTLISSVSISIAQQCGLNQVHNKIFYKHQQIKPILAHLKHYVLNI